MGTLVETRTENDGETEIQYYLIRNTMYCSERHENLSRYTGESRIFPIIDDVKAGIDKGYSIFKYYNLSQNGYEILKSIIKAQSQSSTIRQVILDSGLNTKEIWEWLGIPIRTIEGWMSGKRKPPEWSEKLLIEKFSTLKGEHNGKDYKHH